MKKTVILKQDIIGFNKGEHSFNHVMAESLVKRGKAEYKEEKKVIKTKEEKFQPETKAKPKRKRTKKK